MTRYSHFIPKTILYVTIAAVMSGLLTGCNFSEPESSGNISSTEESVMSTDNIVTDDITTAKPQPTQIVTDKPVATPSATDKMSESASVWLERYKALGHDGDKVLMSTSDIEDFNKRTLSKSDAVKDILSVPSSVSADEIASSIENMSIPSLPKYDWDNNAITQSKLDDILANRNLTSLYNVDLISPKLGVIVQRTALRSLPTDTPFFSDPGTQYYDRIQETEVIVGSGVWVLHESENGAFSFVQTFNYCGWVASEHIAIASSYEEWKAFASPASFATVKAALYKTEASFIKLDMGVKLPLAETGAAGYTVKLPGRNPDGSLYYEYITLGGDIACEGYLPFTMKNFYNQSFKYEGSIYGWGGSYDSVDCSGFVSAVMRVFGFELPRNVSQQRNVVGNVINVNGTGKENIEHVLDGIKTPVAIYKPGHVMLYLGKYNGEYYVIHSPEGGRVVCAEVLDTSASNLMSINKFI